MDRRAVTSVLSTLGVLFFLAMAFDILPNNYAIFLGIACFILSGAVWTFMRPRE